MNNSDSNPHWVNATIFGLEAIKTQTKEPCIANILYALGQGYSKHPE